MQNDIANQVMQIINQIAEELGVATERVYPILLKQAHIEGVVDLITLTTFFLIICHLKNLKKN